MSITTQSSLLLVADFLNVAHIYIVSQDSLFPNYEKKKQLRAEILSVWLSFGVLRAEYEDNTLLINIQKGGDNSNSQVCLSSILLVVIIMVFVLSEYPCILSYKTMKLFPSISVFTNIILQPSQVISYLLLNKNAKAFLET